MGPLPSKLAMGTNLPNLRSFIGPPPYYRRFVQNFVQNAQSLYALRKKGAAWLWEKPQQISENELKSALLLAPVLSHDEEDGSFELRTDGSEIMVANAVSLCHVGLPDPKDRLDCRALVDSFYTLSEFPLFQQGDPFMGSSILKFQDPNNHAEQVVKVFALKESVEQKFMAHQRQIRPFRIRTNEKWISSGNFESIGAEKRRKLCEKKRQKAWKRLQRKNTGVNCSVQNGKLLPSKFPEFFIFFSLLLLTLFTA